MSTKDNKPAEVFTMSGLRSMIMQSIQVSQKKMQGIQQQLKTISQHQVHDEEKPNVMQQMKQSIDLLLKARESLQQFHQHDTNQEQDSVSHVRENHESFQQEKIKDLEDLLCQNISNAYRRQAILLTYVMRRYQVSFDEIWSSLREAQKYNPSDPEIYQTMGRIIRMSGNIDLGITYLLSLTMTPIGTAPQIFISIAELLACRGLSASEKYNKREKLQKSQVSSTSLSGSTPHFQQSFAADLHSYVPLDISIPNLSDQNNRKDEMNTNRDIQKKDISEYRGDEELIEELLELLLQAPIVDFRMQIRLWKELSTRKCLYGLERWKQRLENDYSDMISPKNGEPFFRLEHDDLMLKDALLFLEAAIIEKRLDLQRAEPSRNMTASNKIMGEFDLYSNVDQNSGDEAKKLERILMRLSDYWEGQEGLANLYLEQNLSQQARHWCDIALSKSSKIAEVLCIHACILLEEVSSSKHNMQYQSSSILDRSQYKNYTEQSGSANIQDSIRDNLSGAILKDVGSAEKQREDILSSRDTKGKKIKSYDQEYREQQQKRLQLAKNIFTELSQRPFVFASIRKRALVMLRILELQIKLKK